MPHRETELKLSAHASFSFVDADLNGYTIEEGPLLDLRATYYDTSDLRLARHGVTLRFRSGDQDQSGWTLKLPKENGRVSVRDEFFYEGSASNIPDAVRSLVTAWVRSATLSPAARLSTRRKVWLVRDVEGAVVAEIDDDEVSILDNRRVVARFREIEIESLALDKRGLKDLGDALIKAGATPGEPIPKAIRALGPSATAAPDLPKVPRCDGKDPIGVAVRAALISGVTRILANDVGARLGEVEGVHQMRVGARRLRSDLRTFAPTVDHDWATGLQVELKWLADSLGAVRDLDVLQHRLRKTARGLEDGIGELLASLAEEHAQARARLDAALTSDRYISLLDTLLIACEEPRLTEVAAEKTEHLAPTLVREAWQSLRKKASALGMRSPEEDFHKTRIKAKQARYAAEAVALALGKHGDAAASFAAMAADLQEALGTLQDTAVAREVFSRFAAEHPDHGAINFALGRSFERQEAEAERLKREALRIWDHLDRKKNVRWMEPA